MRTSRLTVGEARRVARLVMAARKGKPYRMNKRLWKKYLGEIR